MKIEAASQAELTYGAIFMIGVTFVSSGLALFSTYNRILAVVLIAVGLVTIVAAALLVDCLVKRLCSWRRRRPPAYDAVASPHTMEAGEASPLAEPTALPMVRRYSLPPYCVVTPIGEGRFALHNDDSSGRRLSEPSCEQDWPPGRHYRLQPRLDSALWPMADRLQRTTATEPWKGRVGELLPPVSDASSDAEHPASSESPAGKCAPRAPFFEPPSYADVLADDLRSGTDSVASPESQTLPADGGRMTQGRSSSPEILSSPLSIGAAPMGR